MIGAGGTIALGTAVLMAAVTSRASAQDAECAPAVSLRGTPQSAAAVAALLRRSGVSTSPRRGCKALRVRIHKRGTGLELDITDAHGRVSTRNVATASTAASLIESWTQQEVAAGITIELGGTAAPAPARAPATNPRRLATVGAELEGTRAAGESWLGVGMAACVGVGPLCVGGLARLARGDTSAGIESASVFSAALLASVELRREIRSVVVAPGLTGGLGWARLETKTTNPLSEDSGHLQVGAQLRLSRRTLDRVAMSITIGADRSMGRARVFDEHPVIATSVPAWQARIGLGLRMELR